MANFSFSPVQPGVGVPVVNLGTVLTLGSTEFCEAPTVGLEDYERAADYTSLKKLVNEKYE